MEKLGSVALVSFGVLALLGIMVIAGSFLGACAGWFVGLFLGDAILGALAAFGVKGLTMWQFGALVGFVGGFIRSSMDQSS